MRRTIRGVPEGGDPVGGGDGPPGGAAALAAAVLDEEEAREAAQSRAREQVIFPDDLLPGVNAEPMSLREGIQAAAARSMFVVLTLLNSLDELEGAAINVLAPEIRETFGISEGTIVFIGTASAAFFVLGAVPMGWLADRVKRVPIVGVSSLFFGFFVFLSGLAVERVHAVLDAVRHRHRQGEHASRCTSR